MESTKKKRGRPRGSTRKQQVSASFLLTPSELELLRTVANKQGMTLSKYLYSITQPTIESIEAMAA